MKILFVYPEMPESCWTFKKELDLVGYKAATPPLGLMTVAAMLPETWEKRLVDENIEKLRDSDIKWADYVFIGGMNVQEFSVRKVISKCKALNAIIVAGGPLFTHEYERFPEVDYLVLNEAEITLPLFLDDLEKGTPKRIYQTNEYADIHTTPIPLWSLAKLNKYPSIGIQYSRGCPFKCDFCDVTALFGQKSRTKTAEQIINELNSIPNIDSFIQLTFADDNLIGNKHELKTHLLPELIKWQENRKKKAWFLTQVSINLADDDEMMELMRDAGFGTIFVGLETPDEQALIASNKNQNTKRNLLENVKHLQKSGFEVMGGFIVGFDSDTPDIFQRQIDFIQESGVVISNISILNAPAGTELHSKMKAENRLIDRTWSFDGATNMIPVMDADALIQGFNQVVTYLYGTEGFYTRVRKFLSIYTKPEIHKNSKFVLRSYMLKGLFYGLFTLGIKDKNRIHFWKLFFWTIKNRPDIWDWSIGLCARGRHFRIAFEDSVSKNGSLQVQLKAAQNNLNLKENKQ